MKRTAVALVALCAVTVAACGSADDNSDEALTNAGGETAVTAPPTATDGPDDAPTPTDTGSPSPADDEPAPLTDQELAALGVNEAGRVLVMEWHKIQDADGRWENSLATFRAQLQELYDRGYRPISAAEFIDGTFPIPAGTSPVLLTFDDSYKEHFFFADDTRSAAHPDSVVGILQALEAQDPTWRTRAVFSFYWPYPFRETDRDLIEDKLRWLVDNGLELANHTYNHDNLRELADGEVVENLAAAERELADVLGDPDHRLQVMTLTQGIWPVNEDLALTGTAADGFTYDHPIALEVGFMPTRSPFHVDYDPRSVQRVQAWLPEFRKWLDWLDEVGGRRFFSDGDPATVTIPEGFVEVLGPTDGFEVRAYAGEPALSTRTPEQCVGEDGPGAECAPPGTPLDADASH